MCVHTQNIETHKNMEAFLIVLMHAIIGILYLLEGVMDHTHIYIGVLYIVIAFVGYRAYLKVSKRTQLKEN